MGGVPGVDQRLGQNVPAAVAVALPGLRDGLIFPTIALSNLPQFTLIGVAQFSPLTAGALAQPEGGKLKGVALHHFAAFTEAAWRENDYLWGRLDGVELLLRTLHGAGATGPRATDTVPPSSPAAAVARAGGALLKDGLHAVLESETDLKRISDIKKRIAEEINALPFPDPQPSPSATAPGSARSAIVAHN